MSAKPIGKPAGIGVAVHSAWAVVVAVSGPLDSPILLERRRIDFVSKALPTQPYHAAAKLEQPPDQTAAFIRRWAVRSREEAERKLADIVSVLRERGSNPLACGVVGTLRELPQLLQILQAHTLMHAAEGQLARVAIAEAAIRLGLDVVYVSNTAWADSPAVAKLGRTAGHPWTIDHKSATMAALKALSTHASRPSQHPSVNPADAQLD